MNGKKLDKFALQNETEAHVALTVLKQLNYSVAEIEKKQSRRNPYPPFTTSTLQQEASRKLGLGATRTMRLAQQLYEGVDIGGETVGLITYMRTDGASLSFDAINSARDVIGKDFGNQYLPGEARIYKATAKNAQGSARSHSSHRHAPSSRTGCALSRSRWLATLHVDLATHDRFADVERRAGSGFCRYRRHR